MNKFEVKTNIKIAYSHNLYIFKKSCVSVVQFIEQFTRFHLYDEYETLGLTEQLEWESLVINHLELLHSIVEKQRKASKQVSKLCDGQSFEEERKRIIGKGNLKHDILWRARNSAHHNSFTITKFSNAPGNSNKGFPSPNISWHNLELSKEMTEYTESIFYGGEKLAQLIMEHCSYFIEKSKELEQYYLEQIEGYVG